MKAEQAQKERIDRALAEVKKEHPGATVGRPDPAFGEVSGLWIEYSFYGSELHLYVWDRSKGRTIAHYTDVVDDLEHALTAPQNARQR